MTDIYVSGASRRSSLTSSLMPEVVVTRAVKEKPESPTEPSEGDKNKLKAPDNNRIWNLLPAPTPTRFVGRMHAVVTRAGEQQQPTAQAAFSRKSSLVSETIQEDPDTASSADGASEKGDVEGKKEAEEKEGEPTGRKTPAVEV